MIPDFFGGVDELTRLLLSATFVLIAAGISRWQSADLERDLVIATVRSFIQLILIGYALELVFEQDNPLFTVGILVVMVTIAGRTSSARVKELPYASRIGVVSIGVGTILTVGILLLFGVFEFVPQDIIPIGGMVVGSAMTAATLVMTGIHEDFYNQRLVIETKLALGANAREASMTQFRRAIRNAMIPMVDATKTVGLIKLPGAMTGMILAGASPLEAVRIQIIVMYMLVGAVTFTGLIAAYLTYRTFFNKEHQFIDMSIKNLV
ncbi:MAG: iron export ABC transporter permease subunit FetB [Chloroflexota bacterium]